MPDETVFSVCARYHVLSGNSSRSQTSLALIGNKTGQCAWVFPVGLDQLQSASRGMIKSSEEVLRSRSLLRAFLPLLPFERRIALLATCKTSTDVTIAKAQAGLSRYTESSGFLKMCRSCIAEQLIEPGFSYWLTRQQLPGIWLCETHKTMLSFYKVRSAKSLGWVLPEHCLDQSITPQMETTAGLKLLRIQSVIAWICEHESIDTAVLHTMLKLRLRIAGLCRSEIKFLSVEINHLTLFLREHYKDVVAPDVMEVNCQDWFKRIYQEKRHYNPLTWAMALAIGPAFGQKSMESEYREAIERRPQRDLFSKARYGAKRTRAPAQLYAAFSVANLKQEVITQTQRMRPANSP